MSNGYEQATAITMPAGLGCIAGPTDRVSAPKVTPLGGGLAGDGVPARRRQAPAATA